MNSTNPADMHNNTGHSQDSGKHIFPFLFFFLFGTTLYSSQFGLLREFLKVVHGNEFTIGIFFFWWLFWGAAGSIFFRIIRKRMVSLIRWFLMAYILWLAAIVVSYGVCTVPGVVIPGYVFKEIVSFTRIHIFAAVMLLPVCSFAGFLFPMGIELFQQQRSSLRWAYILESCGACVAAVLLSIVLYSAVPLLLVIAAGVFINMLLAIGLAGQFTRLLRMIGVGLCVLIFSLGVYYGIHQHKLQGKDIVVVQTRESPYHEIRVITQKEQRSLYLNNTLFCSMPDSMYAEETVHPCLLQVPDARRVLVVGGITQEIVRELEKYPSVRQIDCVVHDPAVILFLERYFLEEKASGVHFYGMDIRQFLRAPADRYDVILMNYPLPLTIPFNYFYTRQFFRLVKNALSEQGVFSFFTEGSEVYVPASLRSLLAVYTTTLQSVFSHVVVLPGESVHFLASQRQLFNDAASYIHTLRRLAPANVFINEQYLTDRLAVGREAFFSEMLNGSTATEVNQAFFPKAYWYAFLWTSQVAQDVFSRALNAVTTARVTITLIVFVCALFLTAVLMPAHKPKSTCGYVFINGFYSMAMFFLIMTLFQVFHGSVYYKISFVVAAYMLGLSSGAFLAGRVPCAMLNKGIIVQSVFSLIFAGLISLGRHGIVFGEPVLYASALCVGAINGFLFILLNRSVLGMKQKQSTAGVASLLYAWDLTGACVAALVFPSFILPLCGVFCSMIFLIGMVVAYGLVFMMKQFR